MSRLGAFIAVVLLCCVAFPTLCFAETSSMVLFNSEDRAFSVLLPASPVEHTAEIPNGAGTLHKHSFIVEYHGAAFIVSYTDHPESESNPQQLLGDIRDEEVSSIKGKLLKGELLSDQRYPGIEFEVEAGETHMLQRVYLVENRVYQLIVCVPMERNVPKEADAFLNSLFLNR